MIQHLVFLQVANPGGIARHAEPVTSGVPLPESAGVRDMRLLRVQDERGNVVPAQFRVLARWGELTDPTRAVRWVLVDFQATVSDRDARYALVVDEAPAERLAGLKVEEGARSLRIDTGKIAIRIDKQRFNLLDEVTAGGKHVIGTGHGGGFIVTALDGATYSTAGVPPRECRVEEAGPLRCVVLVRGEFADEHGARWMGGNTEQELRSRPATAEQLAEYARLRGVYVNDPKFQRIYRARGIKPDGDPRWVSWTFDTDPAKHLRPMSYTARITAWWNQPDVRVGFTLENNGDGLRHFVLHDALGLNDVDFASLYAELPLAGAPAEAHVEGVQTPAGDGDEIALRQSHTTRNPQDESTNFNYAITRNGATLATGDRASGSAALTTSAGSVSLAFDAFWEVFPKSIEMQGSMLRAGLWPAYKEPDEWGVAKHVFADGWHKTHGLLWSFDADPRAAELASRARRPLFAIADPVTWYAETAAWAPIAPAGEITVDGPELQEAIAQFERERRTLIDPSTSADAQDLAAVREHIPGHYGWQYFGGMLKYPDAKCCVLHYDWPMSAFLHFIRTGDRRFFDEGQRFTRHSIDFDQCHYVNDPFHDGMWRWEGTGTHYPNERPFHVSHITLYGAAQCYTHTWSGGYALGYLMTGDRRYFEALERTLNGSRFFWWEYMDVGSGAAPSDQTRSQGWTILHHLYEYRITGEKRWLDDAYRLFSHSLLQAEHERTGCWPEFTSGMIYQTFHLYPIESLVELHYEAERARMDVGELTEFLVRWCRYTSERYFAPGEVTADGKYRPWRNQYGLHHSENVDPAKANLCNFVVFAVSALAYTAYVIRERDPETAGRFDRVAREMFRDRYLYGPDTMERARLVSQAKALELTTIPARTRSYRYEPRFVYLLSQHEKEQGWAFRASQPFLWLLWRKHGPRMNTNGHE